MMDGQLLGAGILFLVPERAKVPSRCLSVIEVDEDPMDEESVVFRYAETGFNSILYVGSTKLVSTQEKAREFSRTRNGRRAPRLRIQPGRHGHPDGNAERDHIGPATADGDGELAPQYGSKIRRLALHRGRPALRQ